MDHKFWRKAMAGAGTLLLALGVGGASAVQPASVQKESASGTYMNFAQLLKAKLQGTSAAATRKALPLANAWGGTRVGGSDLDGGWGLPLWTYYANSSRDGNAYKGTMVGTNPFTNPGSAWVPTHVLPVVLHFNSVATAIDPNTLAVTYGPGSYTTNPNAQDGACLAPPNNQPTRLLMQSPIFQAADFNFGGVDMGRTQYIDAMMRGNFWNASARVPSSYHVLFGPVRTGDAIVIDVPAANGVYIPPAAFAQLFGTAAGPCEGLSLVDVNWFDYYLQAYVIPGLNAAGKVSPGVLPIFFAYNTVWGGTAAVGLGDCCIGGYHGSTGYPTPTQTYSVADFDTTGLFGTAFYNTAVISHELGELVNDPYGINLVPAWGGTGQVVGACQANLEVGDPLTGSTMSVTMPNGFTYQVQELAFFSWYLGAPSVGVNGWFSDNGTFTSDAGAPCLVQ